MTLSLTNDEIELAAFTLEQAIRYGAGGMYLADDDDGSCTKVDDQKMRGAAAVLRKIAVAQAAKAHKVSAATINRVLAQKGAQ